MSSGEIERRDSSVSEYRDLDTPEVTEFLQSYRTRIQDEVRSENTKRAYAGDWEHFSDWCLMAKLNPLPAHEFTLLAYLNFWGRHEDEEHRLAVSTLKRRLVGIRSHHAVHGERLPDYRGSGQDPIRDTLEAIRRDQRRGIRKARAISQRTLRRMLASQPDSLIGLRNRAILLVGFTGAMRRSEITGLDVPNIEMDDEGMVVIIRSSKTDQGGEGSRVYITRTGKESSCPVRTTASWIGELKRDSGPLFCNVNRYGQIGERRLDDSMINLIVKEAVAATGVDPGPYSAHSLRSGLATSAVRAGADVRAVMKQTRHQRLSTLEGYIQDGLGYENNAVRSLSEL